MVKRAAENHLVFLIVIVFIMLFVGGCSSTYYSAMEKVGKHKRDIMVDRVEDARDSQAEAQEQFKSALERFNAVVKLQETDLKKAYDSLNREYEKSEGAADEVSSRIEKVESVAEDLFAEWQDELEQYQNRELRRSSKEKLKKTQKSYKEMLAGMHQAEAGMEPVLKIFRDNVLFLKHNLNAQAIGSLQGEFANLKGEIDVLVKKMNASIESSNRFITDIR
ncbi:MAG: DNA repair protein [Desulfobulbaceae bacterium BRH_c16a]|nr:MAG: DNA repair protein [Desulfobulbaceae bacterium BRH_c16a]